MPLRSRPRNNCRSPGGGAITGALGLIALLALGCAQDAADRPSSEPTSRPMVEPGSTLTDATAVAPVRWYYDRLVTDADLADRTLRELSLMRNTIFARAGHVFTKRWLNSHFSDQPWYEPTGLDPDRLTAVDRANAQRIAEREAGIPETTLRRWRAALRDQWSQGTQGPHATVEAALIARALGDTEPDDPTVTLRGPLEDVRLLDRLLTVEQLGEMSRRDLRLVRNTIFARHGRPFASPVLTQHFHRTLWYTEDASYTDERLTEIDRMNTRLILSVERSLGGPMTDAEAAEEAKYGWGAA